VISSGNAVYAFCNKKKEKTLLKGNFAKITGNCNSSTLQWREDLIGFADWEL
jgi:hypothetical protein